jgi:hypothetical protein
MIPHDSPTGATVIPGFPPLRGKRETHHQGINHTFTANTCPDCGAITIAGIYEETGRRVDIEPAPLTDLDEVAAIRDQVPTYNLHPDLQIMRRFITEIRAPTRVDRHAQHTCGKTYGHGSSTRTVIRSAPQPDEPPF